MRLQRGLGLHRGQEPGHISVTLGPPPWPLTLLPQWILLKAQKRHSARRGLCCAPRRHLLGAQ